MKIKTLTSLFVLSIFVACGGKGIPVDEQSANLGQTDKLAIGEDKEIQKKSVDVTLTYEYTETESGCTTGKPVFLKLEEMCSALKNDKQNNNCAKKEREAKFNSVCLSLDLKLEEVAVPAEDELSKKPEVELPETLAIKCDGMVQSDVSYGGIDQSFNWDKESGIKNVELTNPANFKGNITVELSGSNGGQIIISAKYPDGSLYKSAGDLNSIVTLHSVSTKGQVRELNIDCKKESYFFPPKVFQAKKLACLGSLQSKEDSNPILVKANLDLVEGQLEEIKDLMINSGDLIKDSKILVSLKAPADNVEPSLVLSYKSEKNKLDVYAQGSIHSTVTLAIPTTTENEEISNLELSCNLEDVKEFSSSDEESEVEEDSSSESMPESESDEIIE